MNSFTLTDSFQLIFELPHIQPLRVPTQRENGFRLLPRVSEK